MIEALIHRIKIKQAEISHALAVGSVTTWEAYQRLVGEYQGLEDVLNMVNNMLEEERNQD
jgi:hypothetical protein